MSWSKLNLFKSLSSRIILGFVAAIIVTTIAAGIPAYLIISNGLEQEARKRLLDGALVTRTLLEAKRNQLTSLATLTSQRPTLIRLLREQDAVALADYVQDYLTGVGIDILILCDDQGNHVLGPGTACPSTDMLTLNATWYELMPGPEGDLGTMAGMAIQEESETETLGFVLVGEYYDNSFVDQLATQTGFVQSLILGEDRFVSSIPGSSNALDTEAIRRARSNRSVEVVELTLAGSYYLTALIPIEDLSGDVIALAEVALSVDAVVAARQQALLTLSISTLVVIVAISLVGVVLARRLAAPILQLTEAARRISEGDLTTPIPRPADPIEMATLARALEESRASIQRVLRNLSQEKAWSETLIESILEGIVTIDAQGRITSFSQGAELVTGWARRAALDASIDEVLPLTQGEGVFTDRMPAPGGKIQLEVLTRKGNPTSLSVTVAKIMTPDGEDELALVLHDITEEEALRNLRSYFLANITHEFRTPLSALNASVELLLEGLEELSRAEIGKLLNSIHISVSGLQALIDNLLESLSIETGRFRLQRRPTEFSSILFEAIRVMKPLLDRRQQVLFLDQPDERLMIHADPARLSQVLVNLLSNASKYSPHGKEIDLILKEVPGRKLYVSVADRGPGIPAVERKNLFNRFVRLDTTDNTQYGIGLGLSVVKAIIQEHKGEVGVRERQGGGSVFWFTIPLD